MHDFILRSNSTLIRTKSRFPQLSLPNKKLANFRNEIQTIKLNVDAKGNDAIAFKSLIGEGGYSKVFLAEKWRHHEPTSKGNQRCSEHQQLAAKIDTDFSYVMWELYIYSLVRIVIFSDICYDGIMLTSVILYRYR